MKAVLYQKYGPPSVLKVTAIEKPIPKDHEILVKIHAATVTSGDVRLRSSDFPTLFWLPARLIFGLFKPKKKILGHELSGVVEEKGKDVTRFNIGDEVFGTTTMLGTGSYAEYICLPEQWKHGVVDVKPTNLSFNKAAALPIGGMTALFLLEKAKISKGKSVLVYGASGSVGSYAVQIAKSFSSSVTGVCSTSNIDMVKSLGADKTVDYTQEDYALLEETFDIVFDAVGKTSKSKAKKVLKNNGVFVSIKMLTKEKSEDLLKLKELAEEGKIKPFIDKSYPLEDIVSAHTYVDRGRKKGNVVIEIKV
ncbi:NAD(P)-dependent alcohol dehydrogenase [Flagellimonas sp. 389]|uniref:NAD(P)-dependent alcohol dehydrogenase n=1 Tax=Flagellimonas sp. 389 TaxID=2835862 RepID=UPI001BD213BB|nr:NAD(P)-dependent alcohol dehydrogenase [Flagellimonas sp. 389]MBS9463962.1 NAD(P)-dependent alcohol dehydrogenase [Flagellimonas sp. 389]